MSANDTTNDLANNVGHIFVKTYYETLFKDPLSLHKLYKSESRFSRATPTEGQTSVQGVNEIKKEIENLKLSSPYVELYSIDVHPSFSGSILISVIGSLQNENEAIRPFSEVFVLAPQKPNGFYIYTHTIRFVDNFVEGFSKSSNNQSEASVSYETEQAAPVESESVQVPEKQQESEQPATTPVVEETQSESQDKPVPPPVVVEPIREPEPTPPVVTVALPKRDDVKPVAQPVAQPAAPVQSTGPKTWRDIVNNTPASTVASTSVVVAAPPSKPTIRAVKPVESVPVSKPAPSTSTTTTDKPKSSPSTQSPQKMVVVRHISTSSTVDSVKKALSTFGNVSSTQLAGRLAFVEFEHAASVTKALAAPEPVIIDGAEVKIEAKRKENKSANKRPDQNRNSPTTRTNKPRTTRPATGNSRDNVEKN